MNEIERIENQINIPAHIYARDYLDLRNVELINIGEIRGQSSNDLIYGNNQNNIIIGNMGRTFCKEGG